jgi:hypothetical protein
MKRRTVGLNDDSCTSRTVDAEGRDTSEQSTIACTLYLQLCEGGKRIHNRSNFWTSQPMFGDGVIVMSHTMRSRTAGVHKQTSINRGPPRKTTNKSVFFFRNRVTQKGSAAVPSDLAKRSIQQSFVHRCQVRPSSIIVVIDRRRIICPPSNVAMKRCGRGQNGVTGRTATTQAN